MELKRHQDDNNHPPLFSCAELILPWLTPQELSSISSTSKTLHHLSKSITTARSSDASRSFETLPIPFVNTVNTHPYSYFLYTPRQLLSLPFPHLNRQFWGPINPNPNPNPKTIWNDLGLISENGGCECVEKCIGDLKCPCLALRLGELITECGPSCACKFECGNRVTQKGISVKLKIVRDRNKGWGLHADQFIPSGRFVCQYAGEVVTTKEARRRQLRYDKLSRGSQFSSALLVVREHLPSGKACFRINIDATRIGNVGRFINHSCGGGNLFTILVRNSGALLPRVCFFASRDIQEGEELCFSYGDVRLRSDGLQCFCGSSCCFGSLPSENT